MTAVPRPAHPRDSRRLLATRGVRALVDGTVATVLPAYLIARGLGRLGAEEIGDLRFMRL